MASKTVLHSNVPSPFTVEAYAGLQAVKLGISLDLRSVMIRGDSVESEPRPFPFEPGRTMENMPRLERILCRKN